MPREIEAAALRDLPSLLSSLRVDPRCGLSASEVLAARALHGGNELSAKDDPPLWRRFLDKLKEPMILLLLASAGVSILTGQLDDAVSISVAVAIVKSTNVIIESLG